MYLLLANPEAGSKRFPKIKKQLLATLERLKVKFELVELDNLVDVPEILEKHLKQSTTGIVAVGGNATINTVINSMADEGMPLGIIPVGKTNYLAHSLGINGWQMACRLLADPDKKPRRLGKIGKHYFVGSLEVLAHQNLLGKYLRGESLLKKFMGASTTSKRNVAVKADIKIDDDLKITGPMHKLHVQLNDEKGDKKLRLELITDTPKNATKLWADGLTVESDKKMPVLMGNETAAHTPVEIKGLAKYIEILVPKAPIPKSNKLTKVTPK
jgi:diacylglycerol kinase family enzyme